MTTSTLLVETWHGTSGGYTNHSCRCEACRAAHSTTTKDRRMRKRAERELVRGVLVHPDADHGTESGYRYYGCRCASCRNGERRRASGR